MTTEIKKVAKWIKWWKYIVLCCILPIWIYQKKEAIQITQCDKLLKGIWNDSTQMVVVQRPTIKEEQLIKENNRGNIIYEKETYKSVNWPKVDNDSGMVPLSWFPERKLTKIK